MQKLNTETIIWLRETLGERFTAARHIHSHQDEVYKITAASATFYLKVSASLTAERNNLVRLAPFLTVPRVIAFHSAGDRDYLLISELPGKNLVELIGAWPNEKIVSTFAAAVRKLHSIDASDVFPGQGKPGDVVVHGDMALPNILISAKEHIGFIDFGQLSYGTPELDLADAIWSLQRNIGPDYGELFLEHYGSVARTQKIEAALKFRHST